MKETLKHTNWSHRIDKEMSMILRNIWSISLHESMNNNNNSVQFFIIYVPSQQPQGQSQTQHSVDTSNYIMDNHNIKSKTNYRQALEEKRINADK
jgi:hypothetical protein